MGIFDKRIRYYEHIRKMGVTSDVAIVIISVGLMLSLGFLMTRITKKLKLPNVTAYITVGILIGPYVLNLIPSQVVEGTEFCRISLLPLSHLRPANSLKFRF